MRTLPGSRAQRPLIRCLLFVGDYFASKVSQIDESGAHHQKVSQIDKSGAVGVRHSAAELRLFLKSRLPPIDFNHFLLKNNKFAKSPSSRAGRPRFGFLVVNSIIKDQKSAL